MAGVPAESSVLMCDAMQDSSIGLNDGVSRAAAVRLAVTALRHAVHHRTHSEHAQRPVQFSNCAWV
jgi:hypothetical protein